MQRRPRRPRELRLAARRASGCSKPAALITSDQIDSADPASASPRPLESRASERVASRLRCRVRAQERAAELERDARAPQRRSISLTPRAGARPRRPVRAAARRARARGAPRRTPPRVGGSASARAASATATSGAPRRSARRAASPSVVDDERGRPPAERARGAPRPAPARRPRRRAAARPARWAPAARRRHLVVDRLPHDRMRELERALEAQQVGAGERASRRGSRAPARGRRARRPRAARRRRRAPRRHARAAVPRTGAARAAARRRARPAPGPISRDAPGVLGASAHALGVQGVEQRRAAKSGLPPVATWQAAQNASSGSTRSARLRPAPTDADAERGRADRRRPPGRRAISVHASSRRGSARAGASRPRRAAAAPRAAARGSASQRSDGASAQCRSSIDEQQPAARRRGSRRASRGRAASRTRRRRRRRRPVELRVVEERAPRAPPRPPAARRARRLDAREQRLEELADDAVGELLLELAAARDEHRRSRPRPRARAPRRAAASCRSRRGPRSRSARPAPDWAASTHGLERGELGLALEQGRREPALGARRGARAPCCRGAESGGNSSGRPSTTSWKSRSGRSKPGSSVSPRSRSSDVARQLVLDERGRRAREQHLAAVAGVADPCRLVHREPTYPSLRRSPRPCGCPSARARRSPSGQSCPASARCAATAAATAAPALRKTTKNESPWRRSRSRPPRRTRPRRRLCGRKQLAVTLAPELLEQARRALDVGEQERDRARGQGGGCLTYR